MDAPPPSSPPKCWFNGACSSDSSFVIKGYCSPSRFLSPRGEKRIFRIENSVEKRRNCLPRFSLTRKCFLPSSTRLPLYRKTFAELKTRFSLPERFVSRINDDRSWNERTRKIGIITNRIIFSFVFPFFSLPPPSPPLVRKTLAFVALTLMHYASCIDRMLRKKWKKSLSLPVH